MRRSTIGVVFVLMLLFVIVGCKTVKDSINYYEACKGDSDCVSEMVKAGSTAKIVTTSAASALPVGNSVAEVVGVLVSNIV